MSINSILTLPNPTSAIDPNWCVFSDFILSQGITELNDDALDAYQNCAKEPYLSANDLNHCLALERYGFDSEYAKLSNDLYDHDLDKNPSLSRLDQLFRNHSLKLCSQTIVFKGIGNSPYYKVIDLPSKNIGDEIYFPVFLSTTVCLEVAEKFSTASPRIILKLIGLEKIPVIIPKVSTVKSSLAGNIPEQEVLLNRGLTFEVIDIQYSNDYRKTILLKHIG